MAYLNNIYGNAAYCGFVTGMLQGRRITSTTAGDYTTLRAAALAMAVDVDALIVFDALVSATAAITQLGGASLMASTIAAVVPGAGDDGLAIITAVAALTPAQLGTVDANTQWRAQILHDICFAVAAGAITTDATVAGAQTTQAAAIFAAWTTMVAGLVTP